MHICDLRIFLQTCLFNLLFVEIFFPHTALRRLVQGKDDSAEEQSHRLAQSLLEMPSQSFASWCHLTCPPNANVAKVTSITECYKARRESPQMITCQIFIPRIAIDLLLHPPLSFLLYNYPANSSVLELILEAGRSKQKTLIILQSVMKSKRQYED